MKIRHVGAELLHVDRQAHTDRQTDRQTGMTRRIGAFSNFGNAPKNEDFFSTAHILSDILYEFINVLELFCIKWLISCILMYWLYRNGKCSLFSNILSRHWAASIVFTACVSVHPIPSMEYSLPIMVGAISPTANTGNQLNLCIQLRRSMESSLRGGQICSL
jgi:hypothetical protein